MRNQLPSIEEVCNAPDKAALPKKQVAALGLLTRVANRNAYAAYIYYDRLTNPDIRVAAALMLAPTLQKGPASMQQRGWSAWVKLLASAYKAFSDVSVK